MSPGRPCAPSAPAEAAAVAHVLRDDPILHLSPLGRLPPRWMSCFSGGWGFFEPSSCVEILAEGGGKWATEGHKPKRKNNLKLDWVSSLAVGTVARRPQRRRREGGFAPVRERGARLPLRAESAPPEGKTLRRIHAL